MKILKFSLFMLFIFSSTVHAKKVIHINTSVPACYQLTNTAAESAIFSANQRANDQCDYPILKKIKVDIVLTRSCPYVLVKASYSCNE